jgi:hypothetical protein
MLSRIRLGAETRPGARERDMAGSTTGDTATYEIRIRSELGDAWSAWFTGLRVLSRVDGDTVLVGTLDQATLHAALRRVRDLGLPLISIQRVEALGEPPSASIESPEDLS